MSIGKNIAKYRKAKNLTQEEFGAKLGVTNQAVSKWESEVSYPDIMLLPMIADVLDITLNDLYSNDTMQTSTTKSHVLDIESVHNFPKATQSMIIDNLCRQTNLVNCGSWDFLRVHQNPLTKKYDSIKKYTTLCCLSNAAGAVFVSNDLTVIDSGTAPVDIGALFNKTERASGLKKLSDQHVRKVLSYICDDYFHSTAPFDCANSEYFEKDIKPILRIATKKDIDNYEHNQKNEIIALEKCTKLIRKNELEMKLLYCEYTLDRQKLIIYFESEERVDFRQLVKDLAEEFRVRIELRQVGSRDGAKVLGGLGPCGLIVCCNTFIEEFDNVSIKMAKNQNLSLNPQKISGTCGKLLCCIKYENEVYKELRQNMPDINDIVRLEEGEGKVLSVDVLKRELKVKMFEDEKFVTVHINDVKSFKSKKNRQEQAE